jgi:hypothetical protein
VQKLLTKTLFFSLHYEFFSFHSLKPQVNQGKQEVTVSFSKESGKKIIDPGK